MRFLVLSRRPALYANRRLRDTARRRGHDLDVVDPLACTLAIGAGGPALVHEREEVRAVDAAIPRMSAALPGHGLAVVAHLEAMGVPTLNRAAAIERAQDKLRALQLLAAAGLDVPRTALVPSVEAIDDALERVGGPPVVVKLARGAQGLGVFLADTRAAAAGILEALASAGRAALFQEFVAEARGTDVRVLVVGGRVAAAMRRAAPPGEWRSNLHRGGRGAPIELSPAHERAALEAARALGLDVAGVDLLESRRGPLVLEVNAAPGFEGLESVTGVDVAGAILARAEAIARAEATVAPGRRFTSP